MSKQLLSKLIRYEEEAYQGGYGSDWLESIGEGFRQYLEQCEERGERSTIKGFEQYIDLLHEKQQ